MTENKNHDALYAFLATAAVATAAVAVGIRFGGFPAWTIILPILSPAILLTAIIAVGMFSAAIVIIGAILLFFAALTVGLVCLIPVSILFILVFVAQKLNIVN